MKFLGFCSVLMVINVLFPSLRWVALGQDRLSEKSPVRINSIGAVRIGMTLAEAEKAAGMRLTNYDGGGLVNDRCYYVRPEDRELQIGLMIFRSEQLNFTGLLDTQKFIYLETQLTGYSETSVNGFKGLLW